MDYLFLLFWMQQQNIDLDLKPDETIPDPTIQNKDFESKFRDLLKKLALMDLEPELKKEIAIKIKNDGVPDKIYRLEIALAALIATLWLLQNSVAVVIWAMLIAPFLRPLNALAWWIARGERRLIFVATKTLVLSAILTIFIAWLVSWIVSLRVETSEILARTRPNILDFFIAISGALVAILSLRFSKLSESVAWVAIAAALLPPLAVSGIELYLGNSSLVFSSLMLFLTNILAIIFVWIVVFVLFGYSPHLEKQQKLMLRNLAIVGTLIVLIAIPLRSSLINFKQEIKLQNQILQTLSDSLSWTDIKISDLELTKLQSDKVYLNLILNIPESVNFYRDFQQRLVDDISKTIHKDVNIDLKLIRVAQIQTQQKQNDLKPAIKSKVREVVNEILPQVDLVEIVVEEIQKSAYVIKIVFGIPPDLNIKKDIFLQAEEAINKSFPWLDLDIIWTPFIKYVPRVEPSLTTWDKIKFQLEGFLKSLEGSWVYFDKIRIDFAGSGNIDVGIDVVLDYQQKEQWEAKLAQINQYLKQNFAHYTLDIRLFPFVKVQQQY